MWYSKSSLGHKNGLGLEIYGKKGSISWSQIKPEILKYTNSYGSLQILNKDHPTLKIANKKRYNRFKVGHPTGFIEAFANHYVDIYNALSDYKNKKNWKNKYVFCVGI